MPSETSTGQSLEQSTPSEGRNKLDRAARACARYLHKAGVIQLVFAGFDGMNLSASTLRYFFDVYLTGSSTLSTDAMHKWMMTPTGFLVSATEALAIISFALIANRADAKNSKDKLKRYMAVMWPYFRDVLKATKNAYKGTRSLVQIVNTLGTANVNFLIVPLGLALGVLAILIRICNRIMGQQRDAMMKHNEALLKRIRKEKETLSEEERYQILYGPNGIIRPSLKRRGAAYLLAASGGMIDSLYLYLGVLGVASLGGPALVPMVVFCVIHCVCLVMSRLYDEYLNQRAFKATEAEIELNLYINEHRENILAWYRQLEKLAIDLSMALTELERRQLTEERDEIAKKINHALKEFSQKRDYLDSLKTFSPLESVFGGIQNGLAAYSALNSMLFLATTILGLIVITCPPGVIIATISTGTALLIGFIAYSVFKYYRAREKFIAKSKQPQNRLVEMLEALKDVDSELESSPIEIDSISQILDNCLKVDPSPQFFFQDWFEVVRLFFSGLSKGSKAVEYTLNPLEDFNYETGHYQESRFMQCMTAIVSVASGLVLMLYGLSRYFGRNAVEKPVEPVEREVIPMEMIREDDAPDPDLDIDDSETEEPLPKLRAPAPKRLSRPISQPMSLQNYPSTFFSQREKADFRTFTPEPVFATSQQSASCI